MRPNRATFIGTASGAWVPIAAVGRATTLVERIRVRCAVDELRQLTWETLETYLRSRIAGALRMIGEIREAFTDEEAEDAASCEASFRGRLLDPLEGLIPLVDEMRLRPSARAITPMLSMEILRLIRPGAGEFVWIEAVGEGRFRLRFVQIEIGIGVATKSVFEGDLAEIVGHLERMIEV